MIKRHPRGKTLAIVCAFAALPAVAQAATWSDTFIGYRYGTDFREPNNTEKVRKHVLQLTHASGHSIGQHFRTSTSSSPTTRIRRRATAATAPPSST